jgi:hypothetical protein
MGIKSLTQTLMRYAPSAIVPLHSPRPLHRALFIVDTPIYIYKFAHQLSRAHNTHHR